MAQPFSARTSPTTATSRSTTAPAWLNSGVRPASRTRTGGQLETAEANPPTPGTGSNTYNIVVQATDGDTGATPEDTRSWLKVTVNVGDLDEEGKITLRPTDQTAATLLQPQVGVGITAADLMDGDGATSGNRGISAITTGITYQWYRTTNRSQTGDPLSPARQGRLTPTPHVSLSGGAGDIGKYLRVVARLRLTGHWTAGWPTAVSLYPTIDDDRRQHKAPRL